MENGVDSSRYSRMDFLFFSLLLFASPPNGGFFCLFISGCQGPSLAYLSHLRDDHQPAQISSSTHSRHSSIILAFSYTFTVLIFSGGFSPSLHEKDVEAFIRTSVEAKFPSHAYVQHQVFLLAIHFQPFISLLPTREKYQVWLLIVILLDLWAKSRIRKVNRRNTSFLM